MIAMLGLVPSLLAAAGPLTIGGASAQLRGDRLTVEIQTSAALKAEDVQAKPGKGRVFLYVDGARSVEPVFDGGERTIIAHPRARYTKLEVPWGAGVDCAGPVAIEALPTGVRASLECRMMAAVARPAPAASGRVPPPRRPAPATDDTLRSALALPGAEPKPAPAPVELPAPQESAPPAAAEPVTAAKTPEKPAAAPPPALPIPAPSIAAEPPKEEPASSGTQIVLPALVLAGLGAAAFFFGRRRARRERLIQIIESASLGPKRSLIVARVSGKTMVLGSSEAGIALLGSLDDAGQVTLSEPAAAPPADAIRVDEDLAAVAASTDQGGMLARLFRGRTEPAAPAPVKKDPDWSQFDSLLNESLEDQELRRKLASGLPVKVS